MLDVFVSSTFRDLAEERKVLLENLEGALTGVGMEKFTPDGSTSHEKSIDELRDSDIVVFLISPWYGSLIEECKVDDCPADCPLKNGEGRISYTHCEYKVATAEDKPHQAYIVRDWDALKTLAQQEEIDWKEIHDDPSLEGIPQQDIEHYHSVANHALKFKKEVSSKEYCPRIRGEEKVGEITDHLKNNIIEWYSEGAIEFEGEFCGREDELKDITDKL